MSELKLKSKLTDEEIAKNFENTDLFSGLMEGLEEAVAYGHGRAKATTVARLRSLPDINVAATRKALNLSQKAFASVLGVSTRTVEAWEAGRANPSPTARNLMYLIASDPSLIAKLRS